ncbi:ATP-binding protein [Georgenia thermotolerans]|uniref:ATP-binding protein n=1 Tax=Georgenia thermotolerans TaxID=527326 RepID=A0A7J5URA2_9MICO|nr:ATP-binding protein [Georgenia thermotolerans]KAE8764938.1 ATP-binding protein [Georgenia thermotolerans]
MAGEYLLEGLAVPESLSDLHDLLERVAADHPDVDPGDLMMFETAVIEVAGNVVEHGRPHGKVLYTFRLRVLPDRVEARLREASQAVAPDVVAAEMPDPLAEDGRGLALSRAMLDELRYERIGDANVWTLVRRLG